MVKKAFTLAEILIVVATLGILASLVIPTFQTHAAEARESAAKENLRILRTAIERYAVQHNGIPPGYPNNDTSLSPSNKPFSDQLTKDGDYLLKQPENPFNGSVTILFVDNNDSFPTEPTATELYGWVYKPATKTIKLNWASMDSSGVIYFDY